MPEVQDPSVEQSRLIDVLEYIQHMVRLGEKAVFRLDDYRQIQIHETELKDRVGVEHDCADADGPVWLTVKRLNRIDPPKPPELIGDWVAVPRDPNKTPTVQQTCTATIPTKKVETLLTRGVLAADDVQPALKPREGIDECDVIFRIDRQIEVRKALDAYLNGPWQRWSESEKPRRETIRLYEQLFSLQQSIGSGGAEHASEVVWGIGIARWRIEDATIDHPLVEQLVEINVDAMNGMLTVRPRSTEAQTALSCFHALQNPGADTVLEFARRFFAEQGEDNELSPFVHTSFEAVLRQAVTVLDSEGVYYPDTIDDVTDRRVPEVTTHLVVTDTWAIYARRRSENFYLADVERLKNSVAETTVLPEAARRLVTEPSDEATYQTTGIDLGQGMMAGLRGNPEAGGESDPVEETRSEDYFFPKAYNQEQASIIKCLVHADGVVVQGPPGTGKTHTIANIICHYLATGKRVLVTSKGEAALEVLREHIPEGIRELSISLLTNERDGLKQLEKTVGTLAVLASQSNPRELECRIIESQRRILDIKGEVAAVERELSVWAARHLEPTTGLDGKRMLPMELAQALTADVDRHRWFPDRFDLTDQTLPPKPDPADIDAVRTARAALGADLEYFGEKLPAAADLPDAAELVALHRDVAKARRAQTAREHSDIPALAVAVRDAVPRAEHLLAAIEAAAECWQAIDAIPWLRPIVQVWCRKGVDASEVRLFADLLPAIEEIATQRPAILSGAVELPAGAQRDELVRSAVERGSCGKRLFLLPGFGHQHARQCVDAIRVRGQRPATAEEWNLVQAHVKWRLAITILLSRWRALHKDFGLEKLPDEEDDAGRRIAQLHTILQAALVLVQKHRPFILKELPVLFPAGLIATEAVESVERAKRTAEVIQTNLSVERQLGSAQRLSALDDGLAQCGGAVSETIRAFLVEQVGNPECAPETIMREWQARSRELQRVRDARPSLDTVARVSKAVAAAGAPRWAKALRSDAVDADADDPWVPHHWQETWRWASLDAYLRKIDGRVRLSKLSSQLLELDRELKKRFQEVVKLRTHLRLKQSITDRVATSLSMFADAIRRIGRGTGIRARRFRRDAREAMNRSYSAVPCWIMPTWRVSESLPSELGSFDLVIVDEASQSDVLAVPALLRGRKVLIVGDDKQVSPSAPFVEERKILQLRHNYLDGQPFAPLLLPGASLYSLAKAMFPGERIMLREHFRCVEPIIRFSFQFYDEPLIPLRLPSAAERLDPPLIDVFVTDGRKVTGKKNPAEARAIVDEIARLVAEPCFKGRTIGVVSLIGAQQAHYIQTLLLERIGEQAFIEHAITCGDSATFQGKERDIMFVSMVECPRSQSAKTALQFQQRFNVALSRARDRMYLYRSVRSEDLRSDDLKARVIRHFESPMEGPRQPPTELIDLCDSGFERDVFTRLCALGYRVTPQVSVGEYSIDLVVEGEDSQRLAIELDGDRYHTPERWADDLARQRTLERVGWRFWRCWGSSFALDPDECMADLVGTLEEMRIAPLGGALPPGRFTEHRTVGLGPPMADTEAYVGTDEPIQLATSPTSPPYDNSLELPPVAREIVEVSPPSTEPSNVSLVKTDRGFEVTEVVQSEAEFEREDEPSTEDTLRVEVGNRIQIVYNDEPDRQEVITISAREHDPANRIINKRAPLAEALLGWEEHDEVEIPAGGGTRVVTILRVQKCPPVTEPNVA